MTPLCALQVSSMRYAAARSHLQPELTAVHPCNGCSIKQWVLPHGAHHLQANVAKMLQRVWDRGDIYKAQYSGAKVLQLAFSA